MSSYTVTIKDTHEHNGESFTAEFTSACEYIKDGENFTVTYAEKGGELDGSVVSIRAKSGGTVEITRFGEFNTRLIVERGRRHICLYNTPFGEISMGVYAEEVYSQINAGGVSMKLRYTLDCNSGLISTNTMKITVKQAVDNVTAC